jgi:hypothetical protein
LKTHRTFNSQPAMTALAVASGLAPVLPIAARLPASTS